MGLKATRKLHDDAFSSMMRAPMSFFNLTPIGKTLNFFAKDMDDCDDVLHDNLYMVCTPSDSLFPSFRAIIVKRFCEVVYRCTVCEHCL